MAAYTFTCSSCNAREQLFFRRSYSPEDRQAIIDGKLFPENDDWARETAREGHTCERCGGTQWGSTLSVPAKHSTWDSTGSHGVNGYYSKALGKHVDSHMAEKRIMEKKGFVCEADLPSHYWDDLTEKSRKKKFAQEKLTQTYTSKLAEGKTKEEAVAETFTAEDAKSGVLDETFNQSLK